MVLHDSKDHENTHNPNFIIEYQLKQKMIVS